MRRFQDHPRASASRDDEAFVTRLHRDLTAAGFAVRFDRVSLPSWQLAFHQEIADAQAFDAAEVHGMDDWRHRILQGLRESRLLLACLSPAYLRSEYCEWEFNEYLKHEIGRAYFSDGVAPIYFLEVPGWADKGFEQQCAACARLRPSARWACSPPSMVWEAWARPPSPSNMPTLSPTNTEGELRGS